GEFAHALAACANHVLSPRGPTGPRGDAFGAGATVIRGTDDERHMQRALKLAARGQGRTWPNPVVGAVLVRNGEIVGEGWHRAAGLPHAEAEALARAGRR